jgi:hypothetical protein
LLNNIGIKNSVIKAGKYKISETSDPSKRGKGRPPISVEEALIKN